MIVPIFFLERLYAIDYLKILTFTIGDEELFGFHPEMVILTNIGINRRDRLCGVPQTASAQSLDFLDLGQKPPFLNWKRHKVPIFKK